jgi:hypothetical protein
MVERVLRELGLHHDVHEEWMEAIGGFRRVPGGWLDSSGTIIDQSVRYLTFRGFPMTVEQILEGIGRTDATARGIRQRLFEDPRTVRVSKSEIGLRAWDYEAYSSIADSMIDELERVGGSMSLDEMVERIVEQFGVSPNSVRRYAARPMFYVDPEGRIQLRPEDQPYEVHDDLLRVPACYELSGTQAAWRVPVDDELLRGSGRHIPEQLAGWLRLRPGHTTSMSNPVRPVALAWRAYATPDIGSLKSFAEELGADRDDWLVLVFDRGGSVEVRRVARPMPGKATPATLAGLVGIELKENAGVQSAVSALSRALGTSGVQPAALRSRIRAALEARRDTDILDIADEVLFGS